MTTDFRLDNALNGLSDKKKNEFREYLDKSREDIMHSSIVKYYRANCIAYGLRGDNLVSYKSDKDGKYVSNSTYDTKRFNLGYITVTGRELINFMKVLRKWLSKGTETPKESTKQSYDSVLLMYDDCNHVYCLEDDRLGDAIADFVTFNNLPSSEGIKVLFFNQADTKIVTEEKKYKLV